MNFLKLFIFSLLFGIAILNPSTVFANEEEKTAAELEATEKQVAAKEKEIADLEAKIRNLQNKHTGVANEAELIADQVARIQQQIDKAKLELKRTQLNIKEVELQKKETETQVTELQAKIDHARERLRSLIRLIYEKEQESIIKVFLSSWSLSDVLSEQAAYKELQNRTIELIRGMRQDEERLNKKQQELDSREQGLSELKKLLDHQQQDLSARNKEQKQFLEAKKEEQVAYENLIADARQARDEVKKSIFTLKNSNIEISLNDAVSIAKHANKVTGVRPALLLAVLKVESNSGNYLGVGKYPDDMQPKYGNREAFLRVTRKLGIDPYNTPISARQSCGNAQCWGGAMGPAQFMPSTWEGIENRVMQLTGKPSANPYDLHDAMVAMAIYLADRGASNPSRESEALGRYVAGNNWNSSTGRWYSNKVLSVAKEYEGSI